MRFVDSHLHVESADAAKAVLMAEATGTLLLACGVDRRSSKSVLGLAANDSVRAFVGVHPSEVLRERGADWVAGELRFASGLGEVGLDPKYSAIGPRSAQSKAFLSQLEAAEGAGKPVQVHSRGAERQCLEALSSFRVKSVLMHWFQREDMVKTVMDRGYFISVGPSLLYSKRLQRMVRACDGAQLLTETDSPVEFGPLRGARGPSLVPSVVFRLAELWGGTFEDARTVVLQNAFRYLGAGEKG